MRVPVVFIDSWILKLVSFFIRLNSFCIYASV
jgi:hypothetical protein